jgi:hypothetical protein
MLDQNSQILQTRLFIPSDLIPLVAAVIIKSGSSQQKSF